MRPSRVLLLNVAGLAPSHLKRKELTPHLNALLDNGFWTPLRWPVSRGNGTISEKLLTRGAGSNVQNKSGRTLLLWALDNGCGQW